MPRALAMRVRMAMRSSIAISAQPSTMVSMANPTDESVSDAVRLDFDRRLTLQFRGSVVTSDAGLLAYRELDDALGLSGMAGGLLADARKGKEGRHALGGVLRPSVFRSRCPIGGWPLRRAPADRS